MQDFPEQILPGYIVPLHRSLTEDILLGGAPRSYMLALSTLSAIFIFSLHMVIAGIAIWFGGWTLGSFLARKDPRFMDVFIRYIKYKDFYGC